MPLEVTRSSVMANSTRQRGVSFVPSRLISPREIPGSILEQQDSSWAQLQGFSTYFVPHSDVPFVAFKTAQNNTVRASEIALDGTMDSGIGASFILIEKTWRNFGQDVPDGGTTLKWTARTARTDRAEKLDPAAGYGIRSNSLTFLLGDSVCRMDAERSMAPSSVYICLCHLNNVWKINIIVRTHADSTTLLDLLDGHSTTLNFSISNCSDLTDYRPIGQRDYGTIIRSSYLLASRKRCKMSILHVFAPTVAPFL